MIIYVLLNLRDVLHPVNAYIFFFIFNGYLVHTKVKKFVEQIWVLR